ncbi:unnamed protein product [Caretta caretta]
MWKIMQHPVDSLIDSDPIPDADSCKLFLMQKIQETRISNVVLLETRPGTPYKHHQLSSISFLGSYHTVHGHM